MTIGFLGKLSHNTEIHFRCPVDDVLEGIASKGVKFIKPPKFSAETLAGLTWDLDTMLSKERTVYQPTTGELYENLDGKLYVTFSKVTADVSSSGKDDLEYEEETRTDFMDRSIDINS